HLPARAPLRSQVGREHGSRPVERLRMDHGARVAVRARPVDLARARAGEGEMNKSSLVLWATAPALLWLTYYRPFETSSARPSQLPARVGAFAPVHENVLTPRTRELLGTHDAAWRTYKDDCGHEIYLVAVFHGEN